MVICDNDIKLDAFSFFHIVITPYLPQLYNFATMHLVLHQTTFVSFLGNINQQKSVC